MYLFDILLVQKLVEVLKAGNHLEAVELARRAPMDLCELPDTDYNSDELPAILEKLLYKLDRGTVEQNFYVLLPRINGYIADFLKKAAEKHGKADSQPEQQSSEENTPGT